MIKQFSLGEINRINSLLEQQSINPDYVLGNNIKEIFWINKSDIKLIDNKKNGKCGFLVYNKKEDNWNCYIKLINGNIIKRILLHSPFDIGWKLSEKDSSEISFEDMLEEISKVIKNMN